MLHLPQIKYLGALWGMMEPYVSAYIRAKGDDADGMRAQQDLITIKKLLREKLHHETLHHYIKFLQSKLGLEALEVPQEGRGKSRRGKSAKGAGDAALLSPEEMFGPPKEQVRDLLRLSLLYACAQCIRMQTSVRGHTISNARWHSGAHGKHVCKFMTRVFKTKNSSRARKSG